MPKGLAKQILSYGLIILADKIATDHVFCDGNYIDEDEFIHSIKTEEEVDEATRAYENLCNYFIENIKEFSENVDGRKCWGKYEYCDTTGGCYVYMLPSIFNNTCNQICKIHPTVMLEYLRANKLLIENGSKDRKGWCTKKFGKLATRTRAFIITPEKISVEDFPEVNSTDLPF